MGAVVIRRTMVLPPVQVVGKWAASLGVGHRLSVGIGREKIKTMAGALLNLDLQSVIARIVAIASLVDTLGQAELLIVKPPRIKVVARAVVRTVWIQRGLVHVWIDEQMSPDVSDVARFRGQGWSELMLYREIPRVSQRYAIGAWRLEEVIRVQSVGQGITSAGADRRVHRQRRPS